MKNRNKQRNTQNSFPPYSISALNSSGTPYRAWRGAAPSHSHFQSQHCCHPGLEEVQEEDLPCSLEGAPVAARSSLWTSPLSWFHPSPCLYLQHHQLQHLGRGRSAPSYRACRSTPAAAAHLAPGTGRRRRAEQGQARRTRPGCTAAGTGGMRGAPSRRCRRGGRGLGGRGGGRWCRW